MVELKSGLRTVREDKDGYLIVLPREEDYSKLSKHQVMKLDSRTGLVWIEDGLTNKLIAAHPAIPTDQWKRRRMTDRIDVNGYLWSPERYVSNELERVCEKYCRCHACRK